MCKKLLIVDDDSYFVNNLIRLFSENDYSISLADSLERAKNMLSIDNFDLVLANYCIPGGCTKDLKSFINKTTNLFFMSSVDSHYEKALNTGDNCFHKYNLTNEIKSVI